MPLHEYVCRDCAAQFEAIVSSAKADSVACPVCQGAETRRLISVIAGMSRGSASSPAPSGGGGCCGGSCGCGR